jgi:hypothetical protein
VRSARARRCLRPHVPGPGSRPLIGHSPKGLAARGLSARRRAGCVFRAQKSHRAIANPSGSSRAIDQRGTRKRTSRGSLGSGSDASFLWLGDVFGSDCIVRRGLGAPSADFSTAGRRRPQDLVRGTGLGLRPGDRSRKEKSSCADLFAVAHARLFVGLRFVFLTGVKNTGFDLRTR